MSFYKSNNEYCDYYFLSDPFGLTCNTLSRRYHNPIPKSEKPQKHHSLESLFHSFPFLNKNHSTSNISENQKKNNKKEKIQKKSLSFSSNLLSHNNNYISSHSNTNDIINRNKLLRCYSDSYTDLIDNPKVHQPDINVEEKETHYLVLIYLPDVKREEIFLEKCNNNVVIYGERGRKINKYAKFIKFKRVFTVPDDASVDSLTLTLKNSVLELVLLKNQP